MQPCNISRIFTCFPTIVPCFPTVFILKKRQISCNQVTGGAGGAGGAVGGGGAGAGPGRQFSTLSGDPPQGQSNRMEQSNKMQQE